MSASSLEVFHIFDLKVECFKIEQALAEGLHDLEVLVFPARAWRC